MHDKNERHDSMQAVEGYHAHVYFDAETLDQATQLCREAGNTFPLAVS